MKKPKPRGGKRPGAGAKAADGATGLVTLTVKVTPAQRDKARLLGAPWLRGQIDAAKVAERK